MEYRKIPIRKKNGINARLLACIRKYGFEETRSAVNFYFNTSREQAKREKRIEELKKEINQLAKKK